MDGSGHVLPTSVQAEHHQQGAIYKQDKDEAAEESINDLLLLAVTVYVHLSPLTAAPSEPALCSTG